VVSPEPEEYDSKGFLLVVVVVRFYIVLQWCWCLGQHRAIRILSPQAPPLWSDASR
jgi:hypothetical protein